MHLKSEIKKIKDRTQIERSINMPEVRVEEVDEDFPKVNIACEMISFESNTVQKPYGNNSIAEGKLFERTKEIFSCWFQGNCC